MLNVGVQAHNIPVHMNLYIFSNNVQFIPHIILNNYVKCYMAKIIKVFTLLKCLKCCFRGKTFLPSFFFVCRFVLHIFQHCIAETYICI